MSTRAHLRLDGVAVASAKFVFQALIAFGDLRIFGADVIELRHARGQVFHLLLHLAQLGKNRHALGEHGASGERKPVLRQVAGADALGRC